MQCLWTSDYSSVLLSCYSKSSTGETIKCWWGLRLNKNYLLSMCGTIFQQRWKDTNADIRSTLKGLTLMQTAYLWTSVPHFRICFPLLNSLGSELSSQGHLHSLQLLNVPQFQFCHFVRLKTAPGGNFSHCWQIRDSDHIHQLANV